MYPAPVSALAGVLVLLAAKLGILQMPQHPSSSASTQVAELS
jgi:hypothetical protein